jgi:hypothetical protein
MDLSKIAERLHFVTAFFLWDVTENEMEITDEVRAFTKRYKYLINKYSITEADDPLAYEGDLSEWEEEKVISFDKELNLFEVKFERILRTALPFAKEEEKLDPAVMANKFFKLVSVFDGTRVEINEMHSSFEIIPLTSVEEYEVVFRQWDNERLSLFNHNLELFIKNFLNEPAELE